MLKHLFKALVVAAAAYLVSDGKLDPEEILYIALVSAIGFFLLDAVSVRRERFYGSYYGTRHNSRSDYRNFFRDDRQQRRFAILTKQMRSLNDRLDQITNKFRTSACSKDKDQQNKIASLYKQKCDIQCELDRVTARRDLVAKRDYGPYGGHGSWGFPRW